MPPKKRPSYGSTAAAKRMRLQRAAETADQHDQRLETQAGRQATLRQQESEEHVQLRLRDQRARQAHTRSVAVQARGWNLSAFNYDPQRSYAADKLVKIGSMSKICDKCGAQKWDKESPGLCCSNGKVQLPCLLEPPEPLNSLLRLLLLITVKSWSSNNAITQFRST